MIEKHSINGKDFWLKVDPHPIQRENEHIIPREYFTASYFTQEPVPHALNGQAITDDDGTPKLFESPVAALTFARKQLEGGTVRNE